MTGHYDTDRYVSPARAFLRSRLPVSPLARVRTGAADERLLRVLRDVLKPVRHPARKTAYRDSTRWGRLPRAL